MTRSVGEGFQELDPRIDYFVKYAAVQNFGDYLPELLCNTLLAPARVDADMYRLIGSVIDARWIAKDLGRVNGHIAGAIAFWGCGARKADPIAPDILAHCRFYGVRGALTRDLLRLPVETVLGDPGLLAPLFHVPRTHPETSGRTICIPHIHDPKSHAEILAMSGADVLAHPEIPASETALRDILDRIASAEFVLTASFHGAIIACAYRRPFAFWDNGHIDAPFKWWDFASSVGMPATFARTLAEGRALYKDAVAPALEMPSLAAILDVCPFAPRPSALVRALVHDAGESLNAVEIAALLDALPSNRPAAMVAIQADGSALRAARRRPGFLFRRSVGLNLRRAKRRLRRMLGQPR